MPNRSLALALFLAATASATPTPAPPFPPPILGFVGRFVDSTHTVGSVSIHLPMIASDVNLLAMRFNGAFAAYNLATFPQRVATGPFTTAPSGDFYLPPDILYDAFAPGSGASIPPPANSLQQIDYDSGFFYLAYSQGIVIIDATGHLAGQIVTPVSGWKIVAFHANGRRYAAVSSAQFQIYDVTSPAAPTLANTVVGLFVKHSARSETPAAIAMVTFGGPSSIVIYDPATLVAGGAPLQQFTPTVPGAYFHRVATDGARFFGYEIDSSTAARIVVLTPSGGGTYARSDIPFTKSPEVWEITYGAGYVSVGGVFNQYLISVGGSPAFYDLTQYLKTTNPSVDNIAFAQPFARGGITYLAGTFGNIGDLYTLVPVDTSAAPALSSMLLTLLAATIAIVSVVRLRE